MTFDPLHFLNLATSLSVDEKYDIEARCRTSISRAYYAAHLISRNKLESKSSRFSKDGKAHEEVIEQMKKKNPHIGDMLYQLRRKRNDADYKLNINFSPFTTNTYISYAETIIEEVMEL